MSSPSKKMMDEEDGKRAVVMQNHFALDAAKKFSNPRQRSTQKLSATEAVSYSSHDHLSIFIQLYGSVIPSVLPTGILNVVFTLVVYYLKSNQIVDLTLDSGGHKFMSSLVAYFVVTATSTTVARYMKFRTQMSEMSRSCVDLTEMIILYTKDDALKESAKDYRYDVIYNICILLLVTMGSTKYISSGESVWNLRDLPALSREELKKDLLDRYLQEIGLDDDTMDINGRTDQMYNTNLRAPLNIAFKLRLAVTSWRKGGVIETPLQVNEERYMLVIIERFVNAFTIMRSTLLSKIPFALAQIRRTMLLFWVFTLPLALLRDIEKIVPSSIVIFILSLGFLGLEAVTKELDDPFGGDANDFNDVGMTKITFQTICKILQDCDGHEASNKLRYSFSSFLSTDYTDFYRGPTSRMSMYTALFNSDSD